MDPGIASGRLDRAVLPRRKDPGGPHPRARWTFGSRTDKGGLKMAKVAKRAKKVAVKSPNKPGAKSEKVKLAIIGGSGLYSMPGLTDTREVRVKTPFGATREALAPKALEGKAPTFLAAP